MAATAPQNSEPREHGCDEDRHRTLVVQSGRKAATAAAWPDSPEEPSEYSHTRCRPGWDSPRIGAISDKNQADAANFRRLSVGSAPHDDEDGISEEENSDSDPEEASTAVRSVVSILKQASEEAQENPKVAELKERLINAYPRLFPGIANKNPPDRGRFGTARIKLKPNPKIYRHREYQLQGDQAEAMKKLLAKFIERGWIEPSDSEWASPAFIVPKKEKGEWRLIVDYRGLNEQTEHDSYSLPLIDTILQKQQTKRIFTVLDLKHGYHQMPLHPDSRPCTAMSTPLGPMQWKVVPIGAKNGNVAFQRMMEDLLGPVPDCADLLVDDIIIGSGTEDMSEDELIEAHEKDLRRVLSELDKHNVVCKPTKASLFVREVEFAGHVVGHGQRRPMPGKLRSLHHWVKPSTISELRSFMGFCNYYSGYVRMYAELSGPLHKMLQVGKFDGRKESKKKLAWTTEAEDAFSRLKERLLGQLGLFLVDANKGFVLRTDASDYAVGAVLEQVRDDGSRGVLEPDSGRGPTSNLDPEGEGDVRHCLCAQEVVWPHRITTGGGLYGPSVLTELAQGAHRHPLGTGSKEGPVARDVRQVRPQRRICPGEGQNCGRLPQSMGLPRGQGMGGYIQPWGRRGDRGGQAHHRDGDGQGARGGQVLCGDCKPYRPGQVPGRPSPSYSRGNPRAMDGGPRRASQVGADRGLVG